MTEQDFAKISVADWISDHPVEAVIVEPETSMADLAQKMLSTQCRDAYIADPHGKIIGHLGFGKVASHLLSEHRPEQSHRQLFSRVTEPVASELMEPHYAFARIDESLCEVIHRQLESGIDILLVLTESGEKLGAIKFQELVEESLK